MRKEKKYNYIYKITNLKNNTYYIGMHSTNNLDDGYMGSGKRLWYSIDYHGKENHEMEILEYYDTRKELKSREKELVNIELLGEDLCMNLALGGTGGILNEEHLKAFTKAGINNFYENNEKLLTNLNKVRGTKSYNDNIKKGLINYYKNNKNSFKDKKHSDETKLKMSKSSKGKGLGKTNSQYGSMWITNESENKKISKDSSIPEGWRRGRVIKIQ